MARGISSLNPCENLGAILKDRVEKRLLTSGATLEEVLHDVLAQMKYDTEIFVSLLSWYPDRLSQCGKQMAEVQIIDTNTFR